jgi:hypothetical protein
MNWLDEMDERAKECTVDVLLTWPSTTPDRWLRMSAAFREMQKALEHAMICDMPEEIDFRCDGCEAGRAALAKARAVTEGDK